MQMSLILTLVAIPLTLAVAAAIVYLVYLLIRALRKYLRSGEVRQENREAVESLAQAKAMHDELESLYNPHVDFDQVYRTAGEIVEELKARLHGD